MNISKNGFGFKLRTLSASIVCLASITGSAYAATLTFGEGPNISSDGYTEAGMVLSGTANGVQNWQNATTSFNGTGEREMLFRQTISFSLVSGSAFDLISIDIEDPFGTGSHWSTLGSALVTGSNGATATLLSTDFGTQLLSGFQNITSFTLGCVNAGCQVTADNITFNEATPVPVPASLPLLAGGLGLVAALGRRKRRQSHPSTV